MQHERQAQKDFLKFAEEEFRKHEFIIPPEFRAKFLQAGGSYGEFKLKQDWREQARQEMWDGVLYMGLERLRKEMLD